MMPEQLEEAAAGLPATHRDNILIEACGPHLEPAEIGRRLIYLPPKPGANVPTSRILLEHHAADIFRMHIPTAAGIELAQTIGFMLTQGYVHRNPSDPATWRRIYRTTGAQAAASPIQLGAMVAGISGAGKSSAIDRALDLFPQVVEHEKVPGLAKPSPQLLWLKVDVPGSGKIIDLVDSLARATDDALGTSHADDLLAGARASGGVLANRWLQRISCNFLGLLVIDETQNLFKIETKAKRESTARARTGERPELRIIDDQALKFLLTLSNFSKIPTLYCSTPDGMAALNKRMSTAQRMLSGGFHNFAHPSSADEGFYRRRLFPTLCQYQWLPGKLAASDELRRLLFDLSAGVPRLAMMTWFHATRRALRRNSETLSFEDFKHVKEHALGPLRPAVEALLSNDPRQLHRYEDLVADIPWPQIGE